MSLGNETQAKVKTNKYSLHWFSTQQPFLEASVPLVDQKVSSGGCIQLTPGISSRLWACTCYWWHLQNITCHTLASSPLRFRLLLYLEQSAWRCSWRCLHCTSTYRCQPFPNLSLWEWELFPSEPSDTFFLPWSPSHLSAKWLWKLGGQFRIQNWWHLFHLLWYLWAHGWTCSHVLKSIIRIKLWNLLF